METSGNKDCAPVPLTEAQVEQVSGGLASFSVSIGSKVDFRPVGCLPCTSGGNFKLLDKWQDVINPVAPALGGVATPSAF